MLFRSDVPRGICSACSVACHTDHEQVELFPKRHFKCDCPTEALSHLCVLHKIPQLENEENVYGQNFTGQFCRCGRPYDALKEKETMIQCVVCEVNFVSYREACLLTEQIGNRIGSTSRVRTFASGLRRGSLHRSPPCKMERLTMEPPTRRLRVCRHRSYQRMITSRLSVEHACLNTRLYDDTRGQAVLKWSLAPL